MGPTLRALSLTQITLGSFTCLVSQLESSASSNGKDRPQLSVCGNNAINYCNASFEALGFGFRQCVRRCVCV